MLPEQERRKAINSLSEKEAEALLYNWKVWARPKQLPSAWNYRSRITMLIQSSLARLQEIVQVPLLKTHNASMPVVRELPQPDIFTYSGDTQLEVFSSLLYCQPFIALHALSIALGIAICQVVVLDITK